MQKVFNSQFSLKTGVRYQEKVVGYAQIPAAFKLVFWVFSVIVLLVSCTPAKKMTYFQNIPSGTTLNNVVSKNYEPKIQKGDLLSITVASLSPDNTLIYNAPQNAQGTATGYLVDENGNIDFIKLGTLHVEGMTRKELKEELQQKLTPYLAQCVVAIGFLNRHVTLIGAISPQVLPMPNDNMTILDALAASGDLADKGKPDNIMVIRDTGNSKVFKKLNLTDKSVFYSPYYYLQPNDIIYVEPVKKKKVSTTQIISYVTAGISLVLFILGRVIK